MDKRPINFVRNQHTSTVYAPLPSFDNIVDSIGYEFQTSQELKFVHPVMTLLHLASQQRLAISIEDEDKCPEYLLVLMEVGGEYRTKDSGEGRYLPNMGPRLKGRTEFRDEEEAYIFAEREAAQYFLEHNSRCFIEILHAKSGYILHSELREPWRRERLEDNPLSGRW